MTINIRFNKAVSSLIAHAPKDWNTLIYRAKIYDDAALDIMFDYELNGREDWFRIENDEVQSELVNDFRAVRDQMQKDTGKKWKRVRFTVNKDMTFNADFEYE